MIQYGYASLKLYQLKMMKQSSLRNIQIIISCKPISCTHYMLEIVSTKDGKNILPFRPIYSQISLP